MKITKEQIEQIKQQYELVATVEAHGVRLKKRGKEYVGLCPFHKEKTPSFCVDPIKQVFHCFGCSASGDTIGFLSKIENKSLPTLIRELSPQTNGSKPVVNGAASSNGSAHTKNDTEPHSPKLLKLLSRVVEFYQGVFAKDPKGRDYLAGRGIQDKDALRDFGVGYANGSLLDALPPEGDLLTDLKALGILTDKGHEFFSDCIVVPLRDFSGSITGLYGRRITNQEPLHLYLPGRRLGFVNWQAAKRSSAILLTEAIIDALTLYDQGFKNVIPCYGVTGLSEEHMSCLKQFGVKEVVICFDADEAGKRGAASAANRLADVGITCSIITLPDKDVNDYFRRHTPEEFEALVKEAHPLTLIRSEAIASRAEQFFEFTDTGFKVGFGDRIYEVKGIHRQGAQLRVTLLVRRGEKMQLDSVDLHSLRNRDRFARDTASMMKEREELIRDDLMRLFQRVERWGVKAEESQPEAPSPEIEEAAKKFLTNPNLFDEILSDLDTLGLVGEEIIKRIGYLCCTSRKLDKPLSLLIQSRSAAGKSACIEALLSLMPPEDVKRWTRLTDQALFYQSEMALVHKLIAIEEMAGMGGAAYSIRALQSSGMLSLASVMKDPASGRMNSHENIVRGPAGLLMSTARPTVDEEMASRFFIAAMNESLAQTERILARQRADLTMEGYFKKTMREGIIQKHLAAQRMLKTLVVLDTNAQAHPFWTKALWARRDQPKVLSFLCAIALLFQYQREVKTMTTPVGERVEYVEICEEDWKRAEPLIAYLMDSSRSELPAPSRVLLQEIETFARARCAELSSPPVEIHFTRRELMEATGWSMWQLRTYLPPLIEQEYLYVRYGKWGQEYRYEIRFKS